MIGRLEPKAPAHPLGWQDVKAILDAASDQHDTGMAPHGLFWEGGLDALRRKAFPHKGATLRVLEPGQRDRLVYFAGCDYFRMSSHPEVLQALRRALTDYGLNVAASRNRGVQLAVQLLPIANYLWRRFAQF